MLIFAQLAVFLAGNISRRGRTDSDRGMPKTRDVESALHFTVRAVVSRIEGVQRTERVWSLRTCSEDANLIFASAPKQSGNVCVALSRTLSFQGFPVEIRRCDCTANKRRRQAGAG